MWKKIVIVVIVLVVAIAAIFYFSSEKVDNDDLAMVVDSVPESLAEMIKEDALDEDPIEISTAEELMAIPNGSFRNFRLTEDIDMAEVSWQPIDFFGTLDGNGHAIKNLNVEGTSMGLDLTYDGNMKVYKTRFSGMFGIIANATIKDLKLEDIFVKVKTDGECVFAGSVAGFMENSVIDNVVVNGKVYLKTNSKCFGVGGIAGYGNGEIKGSNSDMCLVCIDENVKEKDEQFMGGAYAAGYINLNGNNIIIDGFDSDHGYVHNGGLVGMYIHYKNDEKGSICDNNVVGQITFFEDNKDRRAYCEPYVGEMMSWNLSMTGNSNDFTRNEVFEYQNNLVPEDYEEY